MTDRPTMMELGTFLQLFVAGLLLAMPRLAPRGMLFGVPVPAGFRKTETGRAVLRCYEIWIWIPTLAGMLGLVLIRTEAFQSAEFLFLIAAGMADFAVQNRKLRPFAVAPSLVRETSLEPAERLPWFTWLGILPFVFLAGVALYVHAHWDQIPERYPVHFGLTGNPDRWAGKSVRSVYGMFIFGGELALFLLVMALASWYGSRRTEPLRKPMMMILLAAECTLALGIGMVRLQAVAGFRIPPLLALSPPILLFLALAFLFRKFSKLRGPVDPTPNECWKAGMIYYNPGDAALFVARRDSVGFTLNFGNRWSWVLSGFLAFVLISGPLILMWSMKSQ